MSAKCAPDSDTNSVYHSEKFFSFLFLSAMSITHFLYLYCLCLWGRTDLNHYRPISCINPSRKSCLACQTPDKNVVFGMLPSWTTAPEYLIYICQIALIWFRKLNSGFAELLH